MISWIRKASKPLLWLIVIIVVVTFAFWGDFTPSGRITNTTVGYIDKIPVKLKDYQASVRETTLGYFLSSEKLPQPGALEDKLISEQSWQRLLLINEANKQKIFATNREVEKAIMSFPAFSKDGNFSPIAFDQFRRVLLPSTGISYRDFENMIRNDLRINRVIEAITLGADIKTSEVEKQIIREHGASRIFVIKLQIDPNSKDIFTTEDILRQFYESRSDLFLEPEKRSFIVAEFPFKNDDPESVTHARDRAVNFTISLIDEQGNPKDDFASLANEAAANIREIKSVSLDTKLENIPDLHVILQEGFKLTKEICDSNPTQGDSAFYVIRLTEVFERTKRPFEKVRSELEREYRHQQAISRGFVTARQLREEIITHLNLGKTITTIASEKALNLQEMPSFIPHDARKTGNLEQLLIAAVISQLETGEISQPQPFQDTIALFFVHSRIAPQQGQIDQNTVKAQLYQQYKRTILAEWLAETKREGSGLKIH